MPVGLDSGDRDTTISLQSAVFDRAFRAYQEKRIADDREPPPPKAGTYPSANKGWSVRTEALVDWTVQGNRGGCCWQRSPTADRDLPLPHRRAGHEQARDISARNQ